MKTTIGMWRITPVPTQRQVKEIRKIPNVRKVSRDGEYSIVHHTATWEKEHLLIHSLGDLGFEVVRGAESRRYPKYGEGMALAKRWKKRSKSAGE